MEKEDSCKSRFPSTRPRTEGVLHRDPSAGMARLPASMALMGSCTGICMSSSANRLAMLPFCFSSCCSSGCDCTLPSMMSYTNGGRTGVGMKRPKPSATRTFPRSAQIRPRTRTNSQTPCTVMPSNMLKSQAWWWVSLEMVRVAFGFQITMSASEATATR